jgi:uncharacterized membrane protein
MHKSKKDLYLLLVIILLAIALTIFTSYRAYAHYSTWEKYHSYFNQPNQKIESWMSINTISTRFNISINDIFSSIGTNTSKLNNHMALDRLCKEYKQNCTDLVEKLNKLAVK